jgi:hypothetical protein
MRLPDTLAHANPEVLRCRRLGLAGHYHRPILSRPPTLRIGGGTPISSGGTGRGGELPSVDLLDQPSGTTALVPLQSGPHRSQRVVRWSPV